MKIAIIIPYFGEWPVWIDLYFFSCSENQEIDWFFFTDCEIPASYSSNLHFIQTSFDTYCRQAGEKLNFRFSPTNPYKLCGLKPFYGFIHQELIAGYDFWGFGDVDIIWGNIKQFYTNKMLGKYDVFSTHADRISGHFTILRNTSYYRELCFKIKDWQSKLQSAEAIALDEAEFSWLVYPEARFINKFYSKLIRRILNWRDAWVFYYNLVTVLNFVLFTRRRRLYFKEQHTTPILSDDGLTCKHDADTWYYFNGKLTNNKTRKEYLYLHFMIYKQNSFRKNYFWTENFYNLPAEISTYKRIIVNKAGIYSDLI